MNGKEFGEWLDGNGIDVEEAAAYFGVSEGSIYKWRSTPGVPDRKLDWVRTQMDAYTKRTEQISAPDRIVLEITNEQFQNWNEAALEEGLLLKDWAIQTLDEALADSTGSGQAPDPLRSIALVSDDRVDYKATKKERGA
jgi:transposase